MMKPGDIVCLKSGSPDMTVEMVIDGNCSVAWFHHGEVNRARFPIEALKVAEPRSVSRAMVG